MISDSISRLFAEAGDGGVAKIWHGTTSNAEDICRWEQSNGYLLPNDYKKFLMAVGRCKLHGRSDHSFAVKFYSLNELALFSERAFGKRMFDGIPSSWYTIADAQDGNFVIMDLATVVGDEVNIIDGCSEYAPNLAIISRSFDEFLMCSINDPNTSSGGGDVQTGARYWSKPGHYYGQTAE